MTENEFAEQEARAFLIEVQNRAPDFDEPEFIIEAYLAGWRMARILRRAERMGHSSAPCGEPAQPVTGAGDNG